MKALNNSKITAHIQALCAFIGEAIDEKEYLRAIVACGEAFLAENSDEYTYKILVASDTYWAWYINQFIIIDKAVMETGVPDELEYLFLDLYKGIFKMDIGSYWLKKHKETKDLQRFFINANLIAEAERELIGNKVKEARK